jgi:hexosaminidase
MIPSPRQIQEAQGVFSFNQSTCILDEADMVSSKFLVTHLRDRLQQHTEGKICISTNSSGACNKIVLELLDPDAYPSEDYKLCVTVEEIKISGTYAGVLYGIETLCHLIRCEKNIWYLACQIIEDGPVMQWRGLMLDCSRHFLSKKFLLSSIDMMPRLKLNRLHLHLNDDQGWRIQIDAYPDLTRVGSFVKTEGFYTKEDLREIVQYAEKRNVMIIPEIEIPGHSFAAVHSYPWLCCTGKPVRNKGHQNDLYCAGKESTFEFLENVLSEIIEIFPSPYIHIGGDEAPKERWRDCAACQTRIKDEELENEESLQAYIIQRCASYLHSHGRRIIGWEEILEGNPSQDAVVQWWRHIPHGEQGIRTALSRGHSVISSPNRFCYLSFAVLPNENFQPPRTSDLRQVFGAELIPRDISEKERSGFLGAECCVWTEFLTEDDIFAMLFPRILAVAELTWRNPEKRDYDSFFTEVFDAEDYWNSVDVIYGPYSVNETTPKR